MYIRSCISYAITKPTIKKQGLYTPLPTPSQPWESISMDYMSDLPSTKHGNNYVFVIVDRFSKMAIMATCKKNIMTEATAKLLFTKCGYTLGSRSPLSQSETKGYWYILVKPLVDGCT